MAVIYSLKPLLNGSEITLGYISQPSSMYLSYRKPGRLLSSLPPTLLVSRKYYARSPPPESAHTSQECELRV